MPLLVVVAWARRCCRCWRSSVAVGWRGEMGGVLWSEEVGERRAGGLLALLRLEERLLVVWCQKDDPSEMRGLSS